jgi:phosphohistidine phosphatase
MLTLSLLRHAKSAWDDPSLTDHERPLAPRGEKAAPIIGRHIAKSGRVPDLVLCSTALRTRQTLALVLLQLTDKPVDIRFDDDLYLATPATMRQHLSAIGASARHVMLVGHNPGLHALALELTATGSKRLITRMAKKFPTTALAVLTFPDLEDWSDVRPGSGTLESFTTPRELD